MGYVRRHSFLFPYMTDEILTRRLILRFTRDNLEMNLFKARPLQFARDGCCEAIRQTVGPSFGICSKFSIEHYYYLGFEVHEARSGITAVEVGTLQHAFALCATQRFRGRARERIDGC